MKSKRIYEYDVVRMIATYSVILVHISAIALSLYEQGSLLSISTIFINRMLKFTSPVFIFLAGALINAKYQKKTFKYVPFITERIKKIVIPYFFVSIFYYVFLAVISNNTIDPMIFLEKVIFASSQYHLYFIAIIMQLYFLTPIFLLLEKKVNVKILMLVLTVVSLYYTLTLQFKYSDRFFIKYIIPYCIGIYFGNKIIDFLRSLGSKAYILLLIIFSVGVIYTYQFMLYFYQLPGVNAVAITSLWFIYCILSCLSLTFIAMKLTHIKSFVNFSKKISSISFYIYLLHPIFIMGSEKLLNKLNITSVSLRFLLNVIIVTSVSTLVAMFISYILKLNLFTKYKKKEVQKAS